jgi:hypothetical protein
MYNKLIKKKLSWQDADAKTKIMEVRHNKHKLLSLANHNHNK